MAFRPRRRETQLAFEALSIEGGLLSPEWLSRVAQLSAGQQSEADYGVPKGLNLRDEIGRYWRIAHAHWQEFASGRERTRDGSGPRAGSTRSLADRFVQALLRESFGFASLASTPPIVIDGRTYPIGLSAVEGRVPVVVAPAEQGLDGASPAFGDGGRKRSPFGLAQEFLNAADRSTWGIVSDGLRLRVLRDNSSLTRPAWIEADLGRIFSEDRYADFAALWLLAHETRFGRPSPRSDDKGPLECVLDAWRAAGREEGTRAREELREGFKEALLALGHGFLAHPENGALRVALQDGSLTTNAYFQQLLRLVYRFIFLLTAEERDLLHSPGTTDDAHALYAAGYGLKRLRDRSLKRSAHDRFSDLWDAMKIVFRGLTGGEPRLGLPVLAGLFARTQCPSLDAAKLENRALLLAVFRLSWLRQTSGLVRVNWRDMGPEELGSVYESLLELEPQITQEGRAFAFATGDETKGNARKKTGSYYTADSLVQALLESALEPVVQNTVAAHPANPIEALLGLSIVDPACGSGHFLLAAARRLAGHVARLQSEGTPSATEYRRALRQVVARCIHGVDLNPMAVELCKVSLWMEAVEPGLPLTFLDSHVQQGNALLGTTPELMAAGIPDGAWEPIEGDDKKIASALRKRSKQAAFGQRGLSSMWVAPIDAESEQVSLAFASLEAATDADPEALARKESQWEGILESDAYRHQRFVADSWCAAFVWPKQPGPFAEAAPTNDLWRQIRDGVGQVPALTAETTQALADQYGFFHWHLAFPQAFARGGFDVVLGNPPWDEVQFEETAWFASRDSNIAGAQNAAERSARISALESYDGLLFAAYKSAVRLVEGTKHFVTKSGLFPTGSSGKLNTSTLFVARGAQLNGAQRGYLGLVVLTGIATDKGAGDVFEQLMSTGRLRSLYDFVNERLLFPAVRPHQHFCLLTLGGRGRESESADFAAFLRDPRELLEPNRHYQLTWDDIVALNPEAHGLPLFPAHTHAEVTRKLCAQFAPFGSQTGADDWRPSFQQGTFNMASASAVFCTRTELDSKAYTLNGLFSEKDGADAYVPLYDAKMARQYEWRAASLGFSGNQFRKVSKTPTSVEQLSDPAFLPAFAYWVPRQSAEERLGEWRKEWILGFKDVTGVTSTSLAAFAFVPRIGIGHVFPLIKLAGGAGDHAFIAAWLNGLIVEWFLRQRMHGLHLTWHILSQVPVPGRRAVNDVCPWEPVTNISSWITLRVAELSVTSWHLRSLSEELLGTPLTYRYDDERRFLLRAEIDAAMFALAGLEMEEAEFVLDSLDKIRARDMRVFGNYRTKTNILSILSELGECSRRGKRYQTRLDPPPADPRMAHSVGAIPELGQIPSAIPILPPGEEAAVLVWAMLHASGGVMRRIDLARAFALRSRPELLVRLATPALAATAETWARTVGSRTVVPGLLVDTLRELAARSGIELATDAESHSIVRISANTPAKDQIDSWYRFEAGLAVQMLVTLPTGKVGTIDAAITGADRALLERVS